MIKNRIHSKTQLVLGILFSLSILSACDDVQGNPKDIPNQESADAPGTHDPTSPSDTPARENLSPTQTQKAPKERRIVFFGDSLMDAPGIEKNERYPELIGKLLHKDHPNWHVINQGVGGNTTADGLKRIEAALERTDIIFICLGGNDFLRNYPSSEAKENLVKIIQAAKERGVYPILAGLKGPGFAKFVGTVSANLLPNQNPAAYESVFETLAREQSISLLDDVLKPIPKAGWWESLSQMKYFDPDYMVDSIHPNAKGHLLIADHVHEFLKKEIARFEAAASSSEEPRRSTNERVFTLYFLGTGSNSNDYQNSDFWDGETVSTIAQLRQTGKEYIDYLVVDGPGSGANQHHKRFKHFGNPIPLENSSGQISGYGAIHNIENAIAVLKLENENPNLKEFVEGLRQEVVQTNRGPLRVVNVIGWSRGAVSGIVFSRYLSRDPFFKDVRINLFAIDPVAGPFWGKDVFHMDANVENYVGIYAENEYSQGFEAIVPIRAKGNEKTNVKLYSIPGKHASLVGADWGDTSLRDAGKLVRGLAEQFLTSHGTSLHGTSPLNDAMQEMLLNAIRMNKAAYFKLGQRESVTTNRNVDSLSSKTNSEREVYLGLNETVCTFMSICGEYESTSFSKVPGMTQLVK